MKKYITLLPFIFVKTKCYSNPLSTYLFQDLIDIVIHFCNDAPIVLSHVNQVKNSIYDCYYCRRDIDDIDLCYYVGSRCKTCSLTLCYSCYQNVTGSDDNYDDEFDEFNIFLSGEWCPLCRSEEK
jgi:hypothetical protein